MNILLTSVFKQALKIALPAALCAVLCACPERGGSDPVPRRTAYSRVAVMDTVMTEVPGVPLRFMVNAQATATVPRTGWLNVAYSAYGATVYVTFTQAATPDSLEAVRANRLQRVMLNTGGMPARRSEWVSAHGFDILTLEADGCTTPFQFLATDGRRHVVSGAVYFADPAAVNNTDSIAPMVAAIEADLNRALRRMK